MTETMQELSGNPGRILKAAREEAGLSLVQAAEALHLRGSVVDAIEREDYATFSSPVFLKGYFRSYCRLLKLHEERMLDLLEKQLLSHYGAMDQARNEQVRVEQSQARQRMVKKLGLFLVLMVVTVTVLFISTTLINRSDGGTDQVADNLAATEPAPQESAATEPSATVTDAIPEQEFAYTGTSDTGVEAAETSGTEADANAEPRAEGDVADTEATVVTPVASAAVSEVPPANTIAPAAEVAPSASSPEPVQPAPDGSKAVSFTFTADCWVKLTDGKGKVLVAELKYGGDSFNLTAVAPLTLVLGNARAVTLTVDNQPYDLLQHTTQNGRAAMVIQ